MKADSQSIFDVLVAQSLAQRVGRGWGAKPRFLTRLVPEIFKVVKVQTLTMKLAKDF